MIARPETLALHPSTAKIPNGLACTVRRRQFLGARTSYQVKIGEKRLVNVDASGSAATFSTGETAYLVFDSAKTLVVAS